MSKSKFNVSAFAHLLGFSARAAEDENDAPAVTASPSEGGTQNDEAASDATATATATATTAATTTATTTATATATTAVSDGDGDEHNGEGEGDNDGDESATPAPGKKKKKAAAAAAAPTNDDDADAEMTGASVEAQARQRERARCSAIFMSPAASVRPDMAAHLAFNTTMKRVDAIATLEAAAAGGNADAAAMPGRASLSERMARQAQAPVNTTPSASAVPEGVDPKVHANVSFITEAVKKARS